MLRLRLTVADVRVHWSSARKTSYVLSVVIVVCLLVVVGQIFLDFFLFVIK